MTINGVVVGKRVTVGAAINSVAAVLAHFFPQHAPAIVAAAVPLTFAVQIAVAHFGGITKVAD